MDRSTIYEEKGEGEMDGGGVEGEGGDACQSEYWENKKGTKDGCSCALEATILAACHEAWPQGLEAGGRVGRMRAGCARWTGGRAAPAVGTCARERKTEKKRKR
jgi:hypothetical protein